MLKRFSERRMLKKMGYLADQQGIINRYIREQGGWDSHLAKCREYIVEKVRQRNPATVTILGSGWLLDVPLEELSELAERVNLVDILHPEQVRHNAAGFKNVSIIAEDITGGAIRQAWEWARRPSGRPDEMLIPPYCPSYEPGMVFSLNILTQTDSLIIDHIAGRTSFKPEVYRSLRRAIQQAHIDYVKESRGVLVTDVEELIMSRGEENARSTLIFGELGDNRPERSWEWEFDNSGEYYRRKSVIFRVEAYDFGKGSE